MRFNNNNNNNNNNNDISCTATARVHSVHAMNTATAPDGRRPLDQANQLEPQARPPIYRQPVNRIHHRHSDMTYQVTLSE